MNASGEHLPRSSWRVQQSPNSPQDVVSEWESFLSAQETPSTGIAALDAADAGRETETETGTDSDVGTVDTECDEECDDEEEEHRRLSVIRCPKSSDDESDIDSEALQSSSGSQHEQNRNGQTSPKAHVQKKNIKHKTVKRSQASKRVQVPGKCQGSTRGRPAAENGWFWSRTKVCIVSHVHKTDMFVDTCMDMRIGVDMHGQAYRHMSRHVCA